MPVAIQLPRLDFLNRELREQWYDRRLDARCRTLTLYALYLADRIAWDVIVTSVYRPVGIHAWHAVDVDLWSRTGEGAYPYQRSGLYVARGVNQVFRYGMDWRRIRRLDAALWHKGDPDAEEGSGRGAHLHLQCPPGRSMKLAA